MSHSSNQMINYNQPSRDELEVSVFGPGRGECIVLHIGNGEWFIVDSCKKDNTSNPVAYDYFKELSVDVERQVKGILVTHWHTDHTKGLPYLVEHCKGANIWFSAALREKKYWSWQGYTVQMILVCLV